MKVAERVVKIRLRQAVEIDKMQFGFRPGTGTTDTIFITRQLTTTTIIYFNKVVFPSVLGLTSPMAFPQYSPPP